MIKQFIFTFFIFLLLISCGNSDSGSGNNSRTEKTNFIPVRTHEDIEEVSVSKVPIEDDSEEEEQEPYEPVVLQPTAQQRFNQLVADSYYHRNSGKLKRNKIAKKLNSEGFTKPDGSRFRIRDIPKRP